MFFIATISAGAWWGFPVQDDTFLIRLLRVGGPERVFVEHPDRPISGFLIGTWARIAGEHRALYIPVAVGAWALIGIQAMLLWARLFPEWPGGAPAVMLAAVSPILSELQFTTVTSVVPTLLPVILVLAALLLIWRGPGADLRARSLLAGALAAAAATVSEYALATAAAAVVLLLMLRRARAGLVLVLGTGIGYAVFRAVSDVTIRKVTNPGQQLAAVLQGPLSRSFEVLSAAWYGLAGSWGLALASVRADWESKSTLFALLVGLGVAAAAALLARSRGFRAQTEGPGRRLLALAAAVVAGLAPAILIQRWPLNVAFETRFFHPVMVFAACATVAGILALARNRFAPLVVAALVFLCADRLVSLAFENRRLQADLERYGERLEPLVPESGGLVVVVTPDRTRQSAEEAMAKATIRWPTDRAMRLWMMRPGLARLLLGPRSGCRPLASIALPEDLRWPKARGPIERLLWLPAEPDEAPAEPYYRGCPGS